MYTQLNVNIITVSLKTCKYETYNHSLIIFIH